MDWQRIALELRPRAAEYSRRLADGDDTSTDYTSPSGFFRWRDLQALVEQPRPQPGVWWWIYAPLLMKLLDGGERSKALLVCLGHHVRTAETTSRQWIHFLPEDLDPAKNPDALLRLVAIASYNASFPEEAKERLLLSTELVEELNSPPAVNKDVRLPTLYPLLLNFAEKDRPAVDVVSEIGLRMLAVDWSPLRAPIKRIRDESSSADARMTKYLSDRQESLVAWANAPPRYDEPIVRCWEPTEISGFGDSYGTILDLRLEALLRGHSIGDDLLLGCPTKSTSLAHWLSKRASGNDLLYKDYGKRLLRYMLWLHDLTKDDSWSQILTILGWLPPAKPGVRSGSIIMYLRSGQWFPSASPNDVTQGVLEVVSCANAFSVGTHFVTAEGARSQQRLDDEQELDSLFREVNKNVANDHNVLWNWGAFWFVRFRGQSFTLPYYRGLDYLAVVLDQGGKSISAADIQRTVDGLRRPERFERSRKQSESPESDFGEPARSAGVRKENQQYSHLEKKARELQKEIDDSANEERKAELEQEQLGLAQRMHQLSRAGPRSETDKAANTVYEGLWRYIDGHVKDKNATLYDHLSQNIKGKSEVQYVSGDKWSIRFTLTHDQGGPDVPDSGGLTT